MDIMINISVIKWEYLLKLWVFWIVGIGIFYIKVYFICFGWLLVEFVIYIWFEFKLINWVLGLR